MKRGYWRKMADLLFSRTCDWCGRDMGEAEGLYCWDCMTEVSWIQPPFCACCGDPAAGHVPAEYVCSWCTRERPAFTWARSAARFEGPVAQSLKRLKYHGGLWTPDGLGELLFRTWQVAAPGGKAPEVDYVVPVPLYPRKRRERTYNQSGLLGGALAERLGRPVRHLLCRIRETPTQTRLTARERAKNVRGAFQLRGWVGTRVEGKRILLVDDVMTTGSTVNECARVLRGGGAEAVYVLTVARGVG